MKLVKPYRYSLFRMSENCECGEKVDELYNCAGCESTMCFHCQTGEQCGECERYFCNNGNDECSDYVEHMSGSHRVCWDCIMSALIALRKQKETSNIK